MGRPNKHGITAAHFLGVLVLGVAVLTVSAYGEASNLVHAKEQPSSHSHLQPSNQTTKSFIVDSDGDEDDVRLGDGQCGTKLVEDRTEVCTLRAAIQEAHVSTGVVKITSESRTIQLVKPLPTIQNPLEFNLNGTTIDGSRSNTPTSVLHINS